MNAVSSINGSYISKQHVCNVSINWVQYLPLIKLCSLILCLKDYIKRLSRMLKSENMLNIKRLIVILEVMRGLFDSYERCGSVAFYRTVKSNA